jgi:hypothetical protein
MRQEQEQEDVPTSFSDIFFNLDPAYPPPAGTSLDIFSYTVTDQDDDGDIGRQGRDSVNGSDIRNSYPGDTVTIQTASGQLITYVGVTFYLANGQRVFSPIDGQTLQPGVLVSTTYVTTDAAVTPEEMEAVPCFTPGTRILTDRGHRPVERLCVGDRVMTQDNGLQRIRWIGCRTVPAEDQFAPIRFMPGALGNTGELLVSPQHRMLLTGWRAQLHFGEDELLVAARHLVNGDTIHVSPRRSVDYIHLMFDRHEVIFAEGIATESFHPGDFILGSCDDTAREIAQLFPELAPGAGPGWPTARTVLKGFEAVVLAGQATLRQSA